MVTLGPMSTAAAPGGAPASGRAVAGPIDRVTFFEEQRRNRRRSWRISLLAVITVLATGIPVSIVVTPFIYVFLLLAGHIANAIRPLDPAVMQRLHAVAYLIPHAVVRMGETKSLAGVPALIAPALVLVFPGAVVMLWLWLAVRITFRHTGVGGVLLRLGAREPHQDDLEERQLVHLVEEMSIAAGVPAPRVLLIDVPAANAAAIGTSLHDGAVVVTRGLLDTLDRDQAEAVIGHVVGSMGNGDLAIAQVLLSVYRTFGLLELLLDSAFGWQSREGLWRLMRLAFRRRGTDVQVREAGELSDLLERKAVGDGPRDMDAYMADPRHSSPGFFRSMIVLPKTIFVAMPASTAQYAMWVSSTLLFGPAFAALWRARRRLADASAVQLTRNPESLASAIERLQQADVYVRGGEWVSFLFATWGSGGGSSGGATFASFQPSPAKRLKRLQAMGAASRATRRLGTGMRIFLGVLWLIFAPLILLVMGLSVLVLAMMIMFDVAIMSVMLVGADAGLGALFKYGPVLLHTYLPRAIRAVRGMLAR